MKSEARTLASVGGEPRVVRYTLPSGRSIVVKRFSDDTGRRTFDHMRQLRDCLAVQEPHGPLAVPRAIVYDASRRWLVQQEAVGVPFPELVDHRDFPACCRRAGTALAVLHGLDLTAGTTKTIDDHVRELIDPYPLVLGEHYPAYRRLIESTLATLSKTDMPAKPAVPLHRDYHWRQLLLDGARIWVVDWDLFARGDAVFDVAYFTTYVKNHFPVGRQAPLIDAFLDGYLTGRPETPLDRMEAYEAFNYLRRACRRFRLRDTGWEAEMRSMLRKLEQCRL